LAELTLVLLIPVVNFGPEPSLVPFAANGRNEPEADKLSHFDVRPGFAALQSFNFVAEVIQ